jgi:hypothetical protein
MSLITPTTTRMTLRALVAFGLVLVAACAGTLDDPDRFRASTGGPDGSGDVAADTPEAAASCPDLPTTLFKPVCGTTAGCHGTPNPEDGLDLVSPDLPRRLVGVPAVGGGLLVDPAHPEASVLYVRISQIGGAPMPPSGPRVDDATLACVLSWVTSLADAAPPDAGSTPDGTMPDSGVDAAKDGPTGG